VSVTEFVTAYQISFGHVEHTLSWTMWVSEQWI